MMKKLFEPVDMTVGDPVGQIVKFMIPMLIGNVFQQLYNTVDSIVVGKYIGDNALAAVGSAGPIVNLLLVLFMGISVGAGMMVSQYFGARQREHLSKSIGCCITMTFLASVIVMIIAPLVTMPLLRLLNTPDEIITWCSGYLRILFLGIAMAGGAEHSAGNEMTEEGSFEDVVADFIRQQGYAVRRNVGASRCRVDIAVGETGADNSYFAGIECDGDSYTMGRTVRERDVL